MTKHLFTLLIPALVAVGSVAVDAQRPVDANKFDEIKMPELPMVPDDADERAIVAYVRKTPAFNLDSALPQIELDSWLTATLLQYNAKGATVEWRLERCENFTSDLPSEAAELCTHARHRCRFRRKDSDVDSCRR